MGRSLCDNTTLWLSREKRSTFLFASFARKFNIIYNSILPFVVVAGFLYNLYRVNGHANNQNKSNTNTKLNTTYLFIYFFDVKKTYIKVGSYQQLIQQAYPILT